MLVGISAYESVGSTVQNRKPCGPGWDTRLVPLATWFSNCPVTADMYLSSNPGKVEKFLGKRSFLKNVIC